jgi:hypothetical protein
VTDAATEPGPAAVGSFEPGSDAKAPATAGAQDSIAAVEVRAEIVAAEPFESGSGATEPRTAGAQDSIAAVEVRAEIVAAELAELTVCPLFALRLTSSIP